MMKKFTKTYYLDKFRVRVWISNTSDRLTIYEVKNNVLSSRIKYELYSTRYRKNLVKNIVESLVDVNIPFNNVCEILYDVEKNLV